MKIVRGHALEQSSLVASVQKLCCEENQGKRDEIKVQSGDQETAKKMAKIAAKFPLSCFGIWIKDIYVAILSNQ